MIDPRKLLAFIAKETQAQPFANPEMYDEAVDAGMDNPANPVEDADEDLEDEEVDLSPEEVEEIADMVEAGEGEDDLMDLAEELADEIDEMGEEAENPPKWAANPAIWSKAEKAVDPEGEGSKYREPYAVVTHVYRKMGGGIK